MCVFCKIVNGTIPSYKIYEDNCFIAILDILPATTGHTLIISKQHFDNIFDLDEQTGVALGPFIIKLGNHLKKELSVESLNILSNAGVLAGQEVNHFHLHIIPRYQNDGISFANNRKATTKDSLGSLMQLLQVKEK